MANPPSWLPGLRGADEFCSQAFPLTSFTGHHPQLNPASLPRSFCCRSREGLRPHRHDSKTTANPARAQVAPTGDHKSPSSCVFPGSQKAVIVTLTIAGEIRIWHASTQTKCATVIIGNRQDRYRSPEYACR